MKFESAEVGGVKLVKTYTLKRGAYDIAVRHDVVNTGASAVSPQLYLQLVRDGNKPPGESSFYSTFTGPAIYTEAQEIPEGRVHRHREKQGRRREAGHQRLCGHGAALLCQRPGSCRTACKRDIFLRKVDTNLYAVGMITPLETIAPGATKTVDGNAVCRPAGRKSARSDCTRPGTGQGLRLADHPGQAAVLAARQAAQLPRQLGLVHRGAGAAAEDRVLLAQCQGLRQHGQDEGDQSAHHGDARAPEGQAAGNAAGDDEDLQGRKGQPDGWLLPHHDPDPGVHRPVLGAAVQRRNAQCALGLVDPGPVRAGSRTSSCRSS